MIQQTRAIKMEIFMVTWRSFVCLKKISDADSTNRLIEPPTFYWKFNRICVKRYLNDVVGYVAAFNIPLSPWPRHPFSHLAFRNLTDVIFIRSRAFALPAVRFHSCPSPPPAKEQKLLYWCRNMRTKSC
jgi:hypothetical protein